MKKKRKVYNSTYHRWVWVEDRLTEFEKRVLGVARRVEKIVKQINGKVDRFMATVAEELQSLHDTLDKMMGDIDEIDLDQKALIKQIEDFVAGNPGVDLAPVLAKAQAIETRLRGVADAVPVPVP